MVWSRPRSWFRTSAFALVLLLFLAVAGFAYQSISVARDRRASPMPGRLVDIGGYRLHLNCTGQGTPAVILDSGLGDPYVSWYKVQPEISRFVRVCSYDRSGLGFSDSGPRPPTSRDIAEELHTLLRNAGIELPVVLVGHSMGGLDVRVYASLYRNEVAGMVLVDSSHPEQQRRLPADPGAKKMQASVQRQLEFEEFAMLFGVPRLFRRTDPFDYCDPNDAALRAAECNFHTLHTGIAAMNTFDVSCRQAATTGSLGDMPLAVLSHDPDTPLPGLAADKLTRDAWEQMQDELAHLSSRGTRMIAKNSSHYIQFDRPDVVIDAVHKVVEEVRQSQVMPQQKP